jgi:SAM-dependent methyltransferase
MGNPRPGRVSRVDTHHIEPRYLALLEAERNRWWDPDNFDTWKNLYISEYARGHDVVRTIRKYAPALPIEGARILDVGCGDAGLPIAFAEAGARVCAIEPDPRSVQRGRVRVQEHGVSVDLRRGVAETLPFPDAAFDLVVLDNVLEHVTDPARTLAEIHRVLAAGALLYLVTPKPLALYSIWNDPHYDLAGLVLMPRRVQVWYFERVRGGGAGRYDVGWIPTRWRLRRLLRREGFEPIVSPRELWIDYLRERIGEPSEVRPGLKRGLAGWLRDREWPFRNRVMRWAWDVALGSNFFLCRRIGRP